MANSDPNAKGGPLKGLVTPPVQGPRDLKGNLKGGKGPYGAGGGAKS
jgi:hypothetical protein